MLIVFFVLISYCLLLIVLWIAWSKAIKAKAPGATAGEELISVVVPVRNEAGNIHQLLESLAAQQYTNFETILVNDHSEDKALETLQHKLPRNVFIRNNEGEGKKRAISTGVRHAKGSIIVTTDADCIVPSAWLKKISEAFQNEKIMFLFGGVRVESPGSFFSALQAIEFASLIGTGASTAYLGLHTMCNGANLAYRKRVFNEVNGYQTNAHIVSGDDEFLMREVARVYPKGIAFLASQSAVVKTSAQKTLADFFNQRLRWAGKWNYNSSGFSKALAFFIVLTQISSIAAFVSLLIFYSPVILMLLVTKVIMECAFLYQVSSFLRSPWNWLAFIIIQVLYPIYVVVIGVGAHFSSYSWKGRKIGKGIFNIDSSKS